MCKEIAMEVRTSEDTWLLGNRSHRVVSNETIGWNLGLTHVACIGEGWMCVTGELLMGSEGLHSL